MKKLVALLLAVLVCTTALLPMGALAEKESVTLKVLAPYFSTYDPKDTPVQQEFVKILSREMGKDVTLEYTYFGWATEFREKLNMAINAADMPWDIIGLNGVSGGDGTFQGNASLYNSLGEQGFFVNLMEKDMPNLKTLMAECGSLVDYMYDAEGAMYFSPMFSENQGGTFSATRGVFIDKTIFDENEIAYPTTKEELMEAAQKLKEIYPDQYPILNLSTGATGISNSLNQQVFSLSDWKLKFFGDDYHVGGITEDYRELLKYCRTLYVEGLIAPDYAAWDQDMITAAKKSGNHAIYFGDVILVDGSGDYAEGHQFVSLGYALAENEGGWWGLRGAMTDTSANTWGCTAINAMSSVIDDACKALDISLGDEAHNLLAMGIEGTSYEVTEDGYKVFIGDYLTAAGSDPTANIKMQLGLCMNGTVMSGFFPAYGVSDNTGFGENTYIGFVMPDGTVEYANPSLFGKEHWTYDNMEPENCVDVSLPSITADEKEYVDSVTEPLYTYMSECFAKFITGEMDINDDAVWQKYLDECNKYDIEGICEVYNKYIEGKTMYNK